MYTLGIDLGGTNIAVGLCNSNYEIVDKGSVPTLPQRDGEEIIKDMVKLCIEIVKRNNLKINDIKYAGIASPGAVNSKTGIVEYANNLPFMDFPIARLLKKHLGVEHVYIANDANAAALGEAVAGAGIGSENLVMITLGTGVGGGVIIDGKIYDGRINCAGAELGHTVIMSGGRQCSCGRRGCWEAYSSATALTTMTNEKIKELKLKNIPSILVEESNMGNKISAKTPFIAMKRGDKYGEEIVKDYIRYLSEGITNMINIFQPEILTIGGGVCNEGDNLMLPLIALVEQDQYTRMNPSKTKILAAKLGNDAGIIGAAALGK